MYDTIIVFDRIRENIPLMKRAPFAQIADVSIWEKIRRSLATTLITVLPIISLLLFGGATLKDFAFALLVGVISGAYSTIFICTPILTILKEREPEYARRKQSAPAVVSGVEAAEVLAAAEEAAAAAPAPEFAPTIMGGGGDNARRERGRQRRRTRPHGRPRQHAWRIAAPFVSLFSSSGCPPSGLSRSPPSGPTALPRTSPGGAGCAATRCAR